MNTLENSWLPGGEFDEASRSTVLVAPSDPEPARPEEFVECSRRSAANPVLGEVHVLFEGDAPPELDDPKIHPARLWRRATDDRIQRRLVRRLGDYAVLISRPDQYRSQMRF